MSKKNLSERTEEIANWLDDYIEETTKLSQKLGEFKKLVLEGETTGNPLKDWAISRLGVKYKSSLESVEKLEAYLTREEPILVKETWHNPHGDIEDDGGVMRDENVKYKIGLLSGEGLKIEKNPLVDKENDIEEDNPISRFVGKKSNEEERKPLIASIGLVEDQYCAYSYNSLKLKESPLKIDPRVTLGLEEKEDCFQNDRPSITKRDVYTPPKRMVNYLLTADAQKVVKELNLEDEIRDFEEAESVEHIYGILNSKK